jgi:hypothetical protein
MGLEQLDEFLDGFQSIGTELAVLHNQQLTTK